MVRSLPEEDIRSSVLSMASHLTIHDHLDKKPHQLSGGQQQRVSFGRAIIIEPQILLLDEPFASLDSATRDEMQKLFLTLAKQHNLTAIFVTHDLKEALLISDQIGVMQNHSVHIYPEKSNFISQYAERVNKEYEFWAKYTQF